MAVNGCEVKTDVNEQYQSCFIMNSVKYWKKIQEGNSKSANKLERENKKIVTRWREAGLAQDNLSRLLSNEKNAVKFSAAAYLVNFNQNERAIDILRYLLWLAPGQNYPETRPIQEEPVDKLKKFFVDDLAAAIAKDFDCSRKTREICQIDFDLLFDSQDPEVHDLSIKSGSQKSANVCFTDQIKEQRCFEFIGNTERTKLRIYDIKYDHFGRSLRSILKLN